MPGARSQADGPKVHFDPDAAASGGETAPWSTRSPANGRNCETRAPVETYRGLVRRFQDAGLALPNVDGNRLLALLELVDRLDGLEKFPVNHLLTESRDRALRLSRAEIGLVHTAVVRGAEIVGGARPDGLDEVRDAFVEGVLEIGVAFGVRLPQDAQQLLDLWLGGSGKAAEEAAQATPLAVEA